ncbi:hypothetical protein EDB89DRAFT_2175623 [Lactarius sanguifluus]|nr:hypothetical protein EDB89DRAFT_2175623 [Lactarius sanguifluus]
MLGRNNTIRSVPVHVGRRARNYGLMTEAKWKKLLRGADEEFAINEALTEIGDPRLTGEVNRLHRQSVVKDTLEELLRDTHRRATDITCQLVDVEREVTGSRICLEMADAYEEINNRFLRTFNCPSLCSPELTPLLITNQRGAVEFSVRHDEEHPCRIRCFGCKMYGHRVQDCVKRKKNHRCKEKSTPSPRVSSTVDHEEHNDNKMTLLERIALLDREDWTPESHDLDLYRTYPKSGERPYCDVTHVITYFGAQVLYSVSVTLGLKHMELRVAYSADQ